MFNYKAALIAFLLAMLVALPGITGIWYSHNQNNLSFEQGIASIHSNENEQYMLSLLAEEIVELSKRGSRFEAGSVLQKSNVLQNVQLSLKSYLNYLVVNSFTINDEVYIQIRSLRL